MRLKKNNLDSFKDTFSIGYKVILSKRLHLTAYL